MKSVKNSCKDRCFKMAFSDDVLKNACSCDAIFSDTESCFSALKLVTISEYALRSDRGKIGLKISISTIFSGVGDSL